MVNEDSVYGLHQIYQVEVSPDLISRVTDAVLEDVLAWRASHPWRRPVNGWQEPGLPAPRTAPMSKLHSGCSFSLISFL